MKRSLRAQLTLGFALIIFITVALISVVSTLLINREFESYMAKQQEKYSAELAAGIASQYSEADGWNVDYIHGMGMYALNDGYFIKVTAADGTVVWDALNHDMEHCQSVMDDIETRMSSITKKNGKFVNHVYPLEAAGGEIGSAEITYYTPYYYNENAFRFVDSLNIILLIMGIISIVGAICVAVLFSKRIAGPIIQVKEIADEIAGGDYSARADVRTGTQELKELSVSINNMAEQIERQETLRRQLTSDVAHELRTPLANVSAQLECISEGVFEPDGERMKGIYDEVTRLSALVGDLEKLQQIESSALEKTRFDLLDAAKFCADVFAPETGRRRIACSVCGESVEIFADVNKIKQVITNLLSNAIKYTPDGGEVKTEVSRRDGCAVLKVSDNGIGIPEKDRDLIFERFYRTDKSRSRKTGGVGIGLTIVKAIVKAHGGTVEVESREGKGSVFTVELPLNEE